MSWESAEFFVTANVEKFISLLKVFLFLIFIIIEKHKDSSHIQEKSSRIKFVVVNIWFCSRDFILNEEIIF